MRFVERVDRNTGAELASMLGKMPTDLPLPDQHLLRRRVSGRLARWAPWLLSCNVLCWVALGTSAGGQTTTDTSLPDGPGAVARRALGTISGLVEDDQGAMVQGAEVRLLDAKSVDSERALTNEEGRYELLDVPPGKFTLTVTRAGFQDATGTGTLKAGESFDAAVITLKVAGVATTVDAMTPEEQVAVQVEAEEHQRLVGILPNFFVSYDFYAAPLRPHQKFDLAWKNARDPGNLALVGITAGIQQATNAFPGYGQGTAGFARRYGADLGNLVSGTFLGGAVLPTLFHQDPRFFYKSTGTVRQRLLYAVTRAVVQRGDNGKWQPGYSSVLGDFAAGALSNAYYAPQDRQGATLTIENGFLGVGGDALNGIFQEFLLPYFTTRGEKKAAAKLARP